MTSQTRLRIFAIAFLLLADDAAAQQQTTVYGRDGRVIARSATDTQGTTTTYDQHGNVLSRETPSRSRYALSNDNTEETMRKQQRRTWIRPVTTASIRMATVRSIIR